MSGRLATLVRPVALVALTVLAWPGPAAWAGDWRVLAGPAWSAPSFATTLVSQYSPPFAYTPHTSHAAQTLPLHAGGAFAAQLAVERALGRHLGLQLAAGYGSSAITGAAGHYDLAMRYVSRPPPTYDPVDVTVRRSEPWPPATGRLRTLAVALDLTAWTDLGGRGRAGLLAGPAWLHAAAEAEGLAYTEYWMGGHSTAFSQDHRLAFEFPADALGLELGGFAEVDFGSRLALRLDLRHTWAPPREAAVVLLADSSPGTRAVDLEAAARDLAPTPVRLDPSLFRAALLVSVRF